MKLIRFLALLLAVLTVLSDADHASADIFGSGANTFDIEFVTIGNPGNAADTTGAPNPAGSVPYSYRMGKFEISEQMIEKANVLGGLGIIKDALGPNKPATSVSWNEATRFVNWLNTSAGSPLAYKFAAQPGDAGYSANANIELWSASDVGYNPNNLFRNSLAKYFLPSVDEWYKAAFYDPSNAVYYNLPTGTDNAPNRVDFPGDPDFDVVVPGAGGTGGPHDVTNVGVLSPYGTAGQAGNVIEWEESEFDLLNNSPSSNRGRRGGSWTSTFPPFLRSDVRQSTAPGSESNAIGFRVASAVPEPSTLLLGALASVGVLLRRWR